MAPNLRTPRVPMAKNLSTIKQRRNMVDLVNWILLLDKSANKSALLHILIPTVLKYATTPIAGRYQNALISFFFSLTVFLFAVLNSELDIGFNILNAGPD